MDTASLYPEVSSVYTLDDGTKEVTVFVVCSQYVYGVIDVLKIFVMLSSRAMVHDFVHLLLVFLLLRTRRWPALFPRRLPRFPS